MAPLGTHGFYKHRIGYIIDLQSDWLKTGYVTCVILQWRLLRSVCCDFLETVLVFALNNSEWYVSYLFAAKLMHLHCLPVGGLFFPNGG
jgi:hypothetical protein